jgi:DNA-directed RNA polymerase subunit RPC12/RpoP
MDCRKKNGRRGRKTVAQYRAGQPKHIDYIEYRCAGCKTLVAKSRLPMINIKKYYFVCEDCVETK